jgi:hypothetical protein
VLVDQNPTTAPYTGYLRQYTYQANGQTRVCTGTENYATGGTLEFSGDGFVQNHTAGGGDFSSGNGDGVPGTTTGLLQGTDHAIIQFDMPNYELDGPYYNPIPQTVPTTVQWFFANGRSDPIFSISQDARQTGGNLGADSRSPYGDMAYDGDGANAYVGGASFGDTYKFATLAANPEQVTTNSGWSYTEPNIIPYAMQWAQSDGNNPVDAEMGHVATLPILLSDQGQDSQYFNGNAVAPFSFYQDNRTLAQPNGPMIADVTWAYQIFAENPIWPANGSPLQSKRLTWGANWGRVGGFDEYNDGAANSGFNPTQYSQHSTDPIGNPAAPNYKGLGNRADGMLMAYSVFVVLGTHAGGYANGTVGKQVIQMENVTHATLTASLGTVLASGPAGVGNASSATITYSPAGYNPTYATWELAAQTNAANATLTPGADYPLDHPVFAIHGYTSSQLPASISVGAGLSGAGEDYFASLDTAGQRLWITVNRLVSGPMNLVVNGPGGGQNTPAPLITSIPSSGQVGAAVAITGQNFTGATAVRFNGLTASFTVNSATQITATVPAGATSGPISVTTPGGTAQSAATFTVEPAPANLPIYVDSLLDGFQDYSWASNVNYQNTSPVYAGSDSISVTAVAYTALWLYYDDLNTSPYASLNFWINGGANGAQGLQAMGVVAQNAAGTYNLPALAPNTWTQFTIPLSALGVAGITNCQGFWFWPTLSGTTTFYVDSVQLNAAAAPRGPQLTVVPTLPRSGSFIFQISGVPGQGYSIQTSSDLANWTTVSTLVLGSSSASVTNAVNAGANYEFWRVLASP